MFTFKNGVFDVLNKPRPKIHFLVIFYQKLEITPMVPDTPPGGVKNATKCNIAPRHPPGGCLVPWGFAPIFDPKFIFFPAMVTRNN